ncbi:MAG: hypothetical protein COV01_03900 [Candidatus Taylorbacteria bacterium CG10_big_fil_rev_8_21_14_0_10_41_48]|uniref:Type II toxin-antitoxin system HicA family toxin n=1 Tax=Candidatus Taylorbacteria bacterium CG10_big_fil_rev_8_21_14_0_10_41_48 TaxID=1975024 RepID=A0A2M8LB25_9BACT|nr:MAG: hypothetical protein COV01_03900 [Candidatus Taylorbacteria bacterium CG10_big_fil_rev_8_21_14_0_10_41_48]
MLPLLPYRKVMRALTRYGYKIVRQRGSHIRMGGPMKKPITVPAHNPVARGTLRKILRDADISAEDFLNFL